MDSMERVGSQLRPPRAQDLNVLACRRCTKVWPSGTTQCARCGAKLSSRRDKSLQRIWAFWIVGLICYIPANMYPMLRTRTLFQTQEDTIVGGAVELIHHHAYGIAAIILIASVLIPVGKFMAVAFLALSVQNKGPKVGNHQRHRMLEIVEYIGRWSMIDVFVVAILSSLVQLNSLAAINPGTASLFFALSVIFTMLSAQSFDPRMIYDISGDARS